MTLEFRAIATSLLWYTRVLLLCKTGKQKRERVESHRKETPGGGFEALENGNEIRNGMIDSDDPDFGDSRVTRVTVEKTRMAESIADFGTVAIADERPTGRGNDPVEIAIGEEDGEETTFKRRAGGRSVVKLRGDVPRFARRPKKFQSRFMPFSLQGTESAREDCAEHHDGHAGAKDFEHRASFRSGTLAFKHGWAYFVNGNFYGLGEYSAISHCENESIGLPFCDFGRIFFLSLPLRQVFCFGLDETFLCARMNSEKRAVA